MTWSFDWLHLFYSDKATAWLQFIASQPVNYEMESDKGRKHHDS